MSLTWNVESLLTLTRFIRWPTAISSGWSGGEPSDWSKPRFGGPRKDGVQPFYPVTNTPSYATPGPTATGTPYVPPAFTAPTGSFSTGWPLPTGGW